MNDSHAQGERVDEIVATRVPAAPEHTLHGVLVDRYLDELLNRGDFTRADEILAPNFVFRGPSFSRGIDRTGFRLFVEELRSAFSNKHFKELERIVEGHRVALRFKMTGTQDGWLQALPPLGAEIDVEGCDLIYIHNGRILEVRAYLDLAEIMRAFLVPPPFKFLQRLVANSPRGQI